MCVLGTGPGSSTRMCALNCQAISPALEISLFNLCLFIHMTITEVHVSTSEFSKCDQYKATIYFDKTLKKFSCALLHMRGSLMHFITWFLT